MMMMMMMMDELTLTWHIVLRLQGHVTVAKESRNSRLDALVDGTSRNSCMSERKARSSVYHEKLAVMTMPELTGLSHLIVNITAAEYQKLLITNCICQQAGTRARHIVDRTEQSVSLKSQCSWLAVPGAPDRAVVT